MTVSEIDLASGLESAAVLNTFALSCPIPVHNAGALNPTKAVEVALAAYRFVIVLLDMLISHSLSTGGAGTWTLQRRLFSLSAFEQLFLIPLHFQSKCYNHHLLSF